LPYRVFDLDQFNNSKSNIDAIEEKAGWMVFMGSICMIAAILPNHPLHFSGRQVKKRIAK
jgi:hypothetical protein